METLDPKKLQFPEDVKQIPDIIVYYCDGLNEKNRMCYVRIPAADLVTSTRQNNTRIYELKADRCLGSLGSKESVGYLTLRINLFTDLPPPLRKI